MRLVPGYYLEATVGGTREWFSLAAPDLPMAHARANSVLEERTRLALVGWAERRARGEAQNEHAGTYIPQHPALIWITETHVRVYIEHTFPYPTGSGDTPAPR